MSFIFYTTGNYFISVANFVLWYNRWERMYLSKKVKGENMFEYLKGTVTYVSPYYIVLEVSGIGFQIAVANPFYYSTKMNEAILLYVHQVVREDAQLLFGFVDMDEKQLFLRLIQVSGIGPKSALAILASNDHSGLIQAIESEDITYLTKFPGVGKKTAQQIVLDLKGKLSELNLFDQIPLETDGMLDAHAVKQTATYLDEAIEALKALGYSERELKKITAKMQADPQKDTDSYLRLGLRLLMKK